MTFDVPYLYASPFPFADALADGPLPPPAFWSERGFRGAVLLYPDADSVDDVRRFVFTVYQQAAPVVLG